MCEAIITGEKGRQLVIKVKNYENKDWLNTEIRIFAGAFSGKVAACLNTTELKAFYNELKSLNESFKGTAQYVSLENWLQIEVSGDGLGHFWAKGFVADDFDETVANRLNFSISFDQTFMPKILEGLQKIIEKYPV